MIKQNSLRQIEDVNKAIEASENGPILIFKHSTSCPISGIALSRVEQAFQQKALELPYYHLDLLAHRDVSNYIAETLNVVHQSPQAIIVHKGRAIQESSHLNIDPSQFSADKLSS